jgi:hypothetical protein
MLQQIRGASVIPIQPQNLVKDLLGFLRASQTG